MLNKKIKTVDELSKIVKRLKSKGKTVALITGCFDIVHLGHIELFRFAKKKADVLVVCIDSDRLVKELKGNSRPINSQKSRMDFLTEFSCIDFVSVFDVQYDSLVETILPNIIVSSSITDSFWRERKLVAIKNRCTLFDNKVSNYSSTSEIINKLL